MKDPRVIHPAGWPRARGYANGMAARGELLAIAGQIAIDTQEKVVSDDFVEQFSQTLRNVVTIVGEAGGEPKNIISLTVFVTDKGEYVARLPEVGAKWRELMGKHYPAMALVEVSALVVPTAKVEIQGLAVLP